jgi:hypothetical protein
MSNPCTSVIWKNDWTACRRLYMVGLDPLLILPYNWIMSLNNAESEESKKQYVYSMWMIIILYNLTIRSLIYESVAVPAVIAIFNTE